MARKVSSILTTPQQFTRLEELRIIALEGDQSAAGGA
jgi:hypothetical protein